MNRTEIARILIKYSKEKLIKSSTKCDDTICPLVNACKKVYGYNPFTKYDTIEKELYVLVPKEKLPATTRCYVVSAWLLTKAFNLPFEGIKKFLYATNDGGRGCFSMCGNGDVETFKKYFPIRFTKI